MKGRFRHGLTLRVVALAATATALVFCNVNACESRAETRAQAANSPSKARSVTKHCSKKWAPNSRECCAHSKGATKSAATTKVGKAKPDKTSAIAAPTSTAKTGQSGMVVGIDPETGILGMPTPDQMRSLFPLGVSALNQSDAGLPILHGPGGAVGVDLQGRFQEYYIVRTGPDGRRVALCLDDPAAIQKALAPSNAPVAAPLIAPVSAPARYEVQ